MGSSNKETIKQQLESIAKPGINVAAFKTVSLPSQIEKQTLIYRTDASNDYLKMCFMEDFDEMPNKIMREASGSSAPSLPSPPQLQRGYKHRLRHRISTCSFIFSNTTGIAKKKKNLCQWIEEKLYGGVCMAVHWEEGQGSLQLCACFVLSILHLLRNREINWGQQEYHENITLPLLKCVPSSLINC